MAMVTVRVGAALQRYQPASADFRKKLDASESESLLNHWQTLSQPVVTRWEGAFRDALSSELSAFERSLYQVDNATRQLSRQAETSETKSRGHVTLIWMLVKTLESELANKLNMKEVLLEDLYKQLLELTLQQAIALSILMNKPVKSAGVTARVMQLVIGTTRQGSAWATEVISEEAQRCETRLVKCKEHLQALLPNDSQ